MMREMLQNHWPNYVPNFLLPFLNIRRSTTEFVGQKADNKGLNLQFCGDPMHCIKKINLKTLDP